MSKDLVLSHINLFAVLRNIEYLAENDSETKKIIQNTNIAIQFNIKDGPSGNLSFQAEKAYVREGKHPCDIKLFFFSPHHFNQMMDGKANPLPLKGLTKINFLTGPFAKIADRLKFYLKADKKALQDQSVYRANTEMTAYTAFFALSEIGNMDKNAQKNVRRIPEGIIEIGIDHGIAIQIEAKEGRLVTKKGSLKEPRAVLSFADLDVAHRLLNGRLDSFTGIATGQMRMKGFIPMIENMNPLLDQVASYLT
ncbi:MAG: hypothetical protein MJB14_17730 [Spirochaetes bacterium]|nr:hypothetical protein [Spirochaetota bacterium]